MPSSKMKRRNISVPFEAGCSVLRGNVVANESFWVNISCYAKEPIFAVRKSMRVLEKNYSETLGIQKLLRTNTMIQPSVFLLKIFVLFHIGVDPGPNSSKPPRGSRWLRHRILGLGTLELHTRSGSLSSTSSHNDS